MAGLDRCRGLEAPILGGRRARRLIDPDGPGVVRHAWPKGGHSRRHQWHTGPGDFDVTPPLHAVSSDGIGRPSRVVVYTALADRDHSRES